MQHSALYKIELLAREIHVIPIKTWGLSFTPQTPAMLSLAWQANRPLNFWAIWHGENFMQS